MTSALIKHLLRLSMEPAYRHECREILIAGHHITTEYKGPVTKILVTERYRKRHQNSPAFRRNHEFDLIDGMTMQRLTKEGTPEGILMSIPYPSNHHREIDLTGFKKSLLLWNLTDPRNLGSLARSALALGWDQLIVYGSGGKKGAVDPFHLEAIRCSKGAVLNLPRIVQTSDEYQLGQFLTSTCTDVLLAEASCNPVPPKLTPGNNKILIMGSESHGLASLPDSIRRIAQSISIKTSPKMPHMSVPAAGAILMHTCAL